MERVSALKPCGNAGDKAGEPPTLPDEPEVVVLLIACGVGLVTGAGVVLFNDAILWIKHLAFLQAPVESVSWGIWARQLSLRSSLLVTLLPPTLGGLTVGLFRLAAGALFLLQRTCLKGSTEGIEGRSGRQDDSFVSELVVPLSRRFFPFFF